MDTCALSKIYGFSIKSCREVTGGWSAAAHVLHTDRGRFFLKIYDKHRPTSQQWINRIDGYMPLLLRLNENAALRGRIPRPVLTSSGEYKHEDERFIYLLSHDIDGETIAKSRLDGAQIEELAGILAALHSLRPPGPESLEIPKEDFDIAFCEEIAAFSQNPNADNTMTEILSRYSGKIFEKTLKINALAQRLKAAPQKFVLCHTDVHGWNLMQAQRLHLIDWEGVRFAPPEADLFVFTKDFFFDYASDDFMKYYSNLTGGFVPNTDAMEFYRLRRRLEDIHDFAASLLHDELDDAVRGESLFHLENECSLL